MKLKRKTVIVAILILAVIGLFLFVLRSALIRQKNIPEPTPSATEIPTELTESPTPFLTPSPQPTATPIPTIGPTPKPTILPQYKKYLKINPDVVGKIVIPDTNVSYPVLWDDDSRYLYLHLDIYKKKSVRGSICIDYTNDTAAKKFAKNTLIFGHNMKDKSMFHSIIQYKDKEFFKEHPLIYFDNLYEKATWKVFAVYLVDADTERIYNSFESDKSFLKYAKQSQKRSIFKTDVELKETDQIITIVTCSYEFSNARTIVQAVRVAPEE